MTGTDALDNADRAIDRAGGALDEAKRLMISWEHAPQEDRPAIKRKLLAELDAAADAAVKARKHLE